MDNGTDNSETTSVVAKDYNSAPIGGLVVRPDGRGALRRGNPGNKGGTGRPPKEVQSRSRVLYERVLDALERVLDETDGAELTMEQQQLLETLPVTERVKLAQRMFPPDPDQLVSIGNMTGKYAGLADSGEAGDVTLHVVRVRQEPTE